MKKIKIAISPEDRISNIYNAAALWNGKRTNEHEQMCRFADALEQHLVRCGFEVYNMQFGNMYDRVAYANSMGVALYIAPHTNGFDGSAKGCRIHHYPSTKSEQFARLLVDGAQPLYYADSPAPKAVSNSTLYELLKPAAPAVLPEWAFHDNEDDAKWIISAIPALAEMTAKACCTYFNKEYVSRETAPMYRIQLGAFRNKKYADDMLKNVRVDFPDAYIVESEE
nr:MAG TPA: Cell wall hydrolase autolysin [Bacteriophage sp.]